MPEGDTLWRTAATLRPAILGKTVTGFRSSVRQVQDASEALSIVGSTIQAIETRGKHLLFHFSAGGTLRTHLQMTGSWHVYRPGHPWKKPARLAVVVIDTPAATAVCFSAPTVELRATISPACGDAVRYLGPDILNDEYSRDVVLQRVRAHGDAEIAVALLDQSVIAGIGNVYKSEVLFLCGVSPFCKVSEISDVDLGRILATAERQMRRNLTTDIRRTTATGTRQRLWVYGSTDRPCQRCGTPIRRRLQGEHARVTFWCPHCQLEPSRSSRER